MKKLSDQVVLITGATGSLGSVIARRAHVHGARLALQAFRNIDRAETLKKELASDAIVLQADVSDRASCRTMVTAAVDRFGRLDGLVNAAGITRDQLALFLSDQDWQDVMAINLTGTFNCSRYAARQMIANRRGCIVNLASVSGIVGVAGQANYAAAKGAVMSLTRSLAREWGRHGIRVNAVAPGLIHSEIASTMPPEKREELLATVAVGRVGTPEEVADVVIFLLSEDSAYITGHTIVVDGGSVMR